VVLNFFPITTEPRSVTLTLDHLVGGGDAFSDLMISFDFWFDDGAILFFLQGDSFFVEGVLIGLHLLGVPSFSSEVFRAPCNLRGVPFFIGGLFYPLHF
jgi:hypothetical protein